MGHDVHGGSCLSCAGGHMEHDFTGRDGKCVGDAVEGGSLVVEEAVGGGYGHGVGGGVMGSTRIEDHAKKGVPDLRGRLGRRLSCRGRRRAYGRLWHGDVARVHGP